MKRLWQSDAQRTAGKAGNESLIRQSAFIRRGCSWDLEASSGAAKSRLGAEAEKVRWIVADVTLCEPTEVYDVWRDRAAYIARMEKALREGGHEIVATFARDGPERCSGSPIVRYDAEILGETLGKGFELIETHRHTLATPWGSTQSFQRAFRFR
jgi:hypothetical protein